MPAFECSVISGFASPVKSRISLSIKDSSVCIKELNLLCSIVDRDQRSDYIFYRHMHRDLVVLRDQTSRVETYRSVLRYTYHHFFSESLVVGIWPAHDICTPLARIQC